MATPSDRNSIRGASHFCRAAVNWPSHLTTRQDAAECRSSEPQTAAPTQSARIAFPRNVWYGGAIMADEGLPPVQVSAGRPDFQPEFSSPGQTLVGTPNDPMFGSDVPF